MAAPCAGAGSSSSAGNVKKPRKGVKGQGGPWAWLSSALHLATRSKQTAPAGGGGTSTGTGPGGRSLLSRLPGMDKSSLFFLQAVVTWILGRAEGENDLGRTCRGEI